ncbi:MAG: radical SAM family heme chaperone HemW [Christensenellales bacterium]
MTNKQEKIDFYKNLNLKSVDISESVEKTEKQLALYVHLPFCERKCNYCSFVSFCDKQNKIDEYISCLLKELEIRKVDNCRLKSIYFGGGTPSLLSEIQIEKLMNGIKAVYDICEDAEITIEVNPNSVTKEKLNAYKNVGINRVSVGVQSLSNGKLKMLGRLHTSKQAIETLKLVKDCGFDNVSCDLIIGLPKQTVFDLNWQISKLSKYVTHFSIYSLSIEENTPFFDKFNCGELKLPNEKRSALLYLKAVKRLKKFKFERYEVSNFALKNMQSIHNKVYWEMRDYLGIGVASHSFINGERFANVEDFDIYMTNISNGKIAYSKETLTKTALMEETVMLSLRESEGLDLKAFESKFNKNLLKEKKKEIALLKQLELITVENDRLRATDKGFLVLNQIIINLI